MPVPLPLYSPILAHAPANACVGTCCCQSGRNQPLRYRRTVGGNATAERPGSFKGSLGGGLVAERHGVTVQTVG